jgi:hypothetical protein
VQQLRLRLALALPITQVIVAAVLEFYTHPPDLEAPLPLARQICWGVNAPALPIRGFGLMISGLILPTGHTIDASEPCFLAGVFLCWYLVGRALDRRIGGLPAAPSGRKGFVVLGSLFALGLYLCLEALGEGVRQVGRTPFALLLGVWAVILIAGSVHGLTRIRRGRGEQPESTRA